MSDVESIKRQIDFIKETQLKDEHITADIQTNFASFMKQLMDFKADMRKKNEEMKAEMKALKDTVDDVRRKSGIGEEGLSNRELRMEIDNLKEVKEKTNETLLEVRGSIMNVKTQVLKSKDKELEQMKVDNLRLKEFIDDVKGKLGEIADLKKKLQENKKEGEKEREVKKESEKVEVKVDATMFDSKIKELVDKIEAQNQVIEHQKEENDALKQQLEEIKKEMSETKTTVINNIIQQEKKEEEKKKKEEKQPEEIIEKRVVTVKDNVLELCNKYTVDGKEKKCLIIVTMKDECIDIALVTEEEVNVYYGCTIKRVDVQPLMSVLDHCVIHKENDTMKITYSTHELVLSKKDDVNVWPRIVRLYHFFNTKYNDFIDVDGVDVTKLEDVDIQLQLLGEEEPVKEPPKKPTPDIIIPEVGKSVVVTETAKKVAIPEPKKYIFVFSSVPTQFQSRRIAQLNKHIKGYDVTDFWNGYGSKIIPNKLVMYYIYENENIDYQDDVDALNTVYPGVKVYVVILNYAEYCLTTPDTKGKKDVFVINVISNILEEKESFNNFIKALKEN